MLLKNIFDGPDGIFVTFSDIRRMKSILMPSNAASLTGEVLRQLGDEGLRWATQSGRWERLTITFAFYAYSDLLSVISLAYPC